MGEYMYVESPMYNCPIIQPVLMLTGYLTVHRTPFQKTW